MAKIFRLFLILVLAALVLAACNLPGRLSRAGGEVSLTQAAQTINAQMTLNAQNQLPTATTPAGETSQPTITIAPTNTSSPDATATEQPCDLAQYVKDVTVPDGTEMKPNETFTKTWRIENLGTCTWTSGYKIVFDEGDAMSGPSSQAITGGTVAPDAQVDISIDLTAPASMGTYRGTYQLRNADGVIFTASGFWVEIEVVEPDAYSSKSSYTIEENNFGDLDEGALPSDPGDDDFYITVAAPDDKFMDPTNGAEFRQMGEDEPTYEECNEASLDDDEISVDENLVDEWFCYVTSEGRIGKFLVVSL
ncbi:MAG TPA: NBR1-Ig-like domain-containing protein, partial [Anaerolineales bacterium]|nr:NBR1-Ig-like domain-containing protein [Anaerolineales bacterium]